MHSRTFSNTFLFSENVTMSKALPNPAAVRQDKRFPVMPPRKDMIAMSANPRPSGRERHRPGNGPPIDDWEAVLIGRQLIKEDAAFTRGQNEEEGALSVKGVRGVLTFCIANVEGALARVPLEIVKKIEQVLHDNVRLLC